MEQVCDLFEIDAVGFVERVEFGTIDVEDSSHFAACIVEGHDNLGCGGARQSRFWKQSCMRCGQGTGQRLGQLASDWFARRYRTRHVLFGCACMPSGLGKVRGRAYRPVHGRIQSTRNQKSRGAWRPRWPCWRWGHFLLLQQLRSAGGVLRTSRVCYQRIFQDVRTFFNLNLCAKIARKKQFGNF